MKTRKSQPAQRQKEAKEKEKEKTTTATAEKSAGRHVENWRQKPARRSSLLSRLASPAQRLSAGTEAQHAQASFKRRGRRPRRTQGGAERKKKVEPRSRNSGSSSLSPSALSFPPLLHSPPREPKEAADQPQRDAQEDTLDLDAALATSTTLTEGEGPEAEATAGTAALAKAPAKRPRRAKGKAVPRIAKRPKRALQLWGQPSPPRAEHALIDWQQRSPSASAAPPQPPLPHSDFSALLHPQGGPAQSGSNHRRVEWHYSGGRFSTGAAEATRNTAAAAEGSPLRFTTTPPRQVRWDDAAASRLSAASGMSYHGAPSSGIEADFHGAAGLSSTGRSSSSHIDEAAAAAQWESLMTHSVSGHGRAKRNPALLLPPPGVVGQAQLDPPNSSPGVLERASQLSPPPPPHFGGSLPETPQHGMPRGLDASPLAYMSPALREAQRRYAMTVGSPGGGDHSPRFAGRSGQHDSAMAWLSPQPGLRLNAHPSADATVILPPPLTGSTASSVTSPSLLQGCLSPLCFDPAEESAPALSLQRGARDVYLPQRVHVPQGTAPVSLDTIGDAEVEATVEALLQCSPEPAANTRHASWLVAGAPSTPQSWPSPLSQRLQRLARPSSYLHRMRVRGLVALSGAEPGSAPAFVVVPPSGPMQQGRVVFDRSGGALTIRCGSNTLPRPRQWIWQMRF